MRSFLPIGLMFAAGMSLASGPALADVSQIATASGPARASQSPGRSSYITVLNQLDAKAWDAAKASIIALDRTDPMRPYLLGELYTAKDSPRVELFDLLDLLNTAPWLGRADQIAALAQKRGATIVPQGPSVQKLVFTGTSPQRAILKSEKGDPVADRIAPAVLDFIRNDQPAECEALIASEAATLSLASLTELRQRVAWSYFLTGDNRNARRLAQAAGANGTGAFVAPAWWVAGLAAWRESDWQGAAAAFTNVAARSDDPDLRSAGYFWAARAHMAARQPYKVTALLQAAAREEESFYGLLARETLGEQRPDASVTIENARPRVAEFATLPNVQVAAHLVALGRIAEADKALRRQAELGGAAQYDEVLAFAEARSLPSTQLWLAHRSPNGVRPGSSARFPVPAWQPRDGWRVDKALVLAHTLQESRFQTEVVSPAGARGLMQVMPGTARGLTAERGEVFAEAQLNDPAFNMELGQRYLEKLSRMPATNGLLAKVVAAYNAGPTPVERWRSQIRDMGDPLLFIESVPYYETRSYVNAVLRNYWMYQIKDKGRSEALLSMAQGLWSRFPGSGGEIAIRLDARGAAQHD